jgi:hypothetical protein
MAYSCNACGRWVESGSCECYRPDDPFAAWHAKVEHLTHERDAAQKEVSRLENVLSEYMLARNAEDEAVLAVLHASEAERDAALDEAQTLRAIIVSLRALLDECLDVVEHEAVTFKCDLVSRVRAALEARP